MDTAILFGPSGTQRPVRDSPTSRNFQASQLPGGRPARPPGFCSRVTDNVEPPSTIESMIRFLEQLIAAVWNRLATRRRGARFQGGRLDLGYLVADGRATRSRVTLTSRERMRYVVVLRKTGSGKSHQQAEQGFQKQILAGAEQLRANLDTGVSQRNGGWDTLISSAKYTR
jgi:hypothetical protein